MTSIGNPGMLTTTTVTIGGLHGGMHEVTARCPDGSVVVRLLRHAPKWVHHYGEDYVVVGDEEMRPGRFIEWLRSQPS